ncbi:hypothetical protein UlMin_003022 [Ulmus minor]
MELQLALSLFPTNEGVDSNDESFTNNKKRIFSQAFDHQAVPRTLPLLIWNNQPNEEDNTKDLEKSHSFNIIKNGEDGIVGWPPIKTWRKKLCFHGENNRAVENGCGCGGRISKFMYVKVKMEGVAIARKVDLSVHHSFKSLFDTLMDMFGKHEEQWNSYKLAFQDREGDWLLAQDISWRTFIRSVQRLMLKKRK